MSEKFVPDFLTLPVELVYRILDNLDEYTVLCSMRNVSTRINAIVNSYCPYQVNFSFIINLYVYHLYVSLVLFPKRILFDRTE
jgi:hypothetical protein